MIRHHGDDQNLPPSDPSRKPNFNYIHYKLQCKKCEKATPQPSPPSWAPAPQSQVIDYDSGDCDGKAGFADLSIQTRTLLWLALSHHALALDLAGEAALQELAGKQFKYECTPCTSGK